MSLSIYAVSKKKQQPPDPRRRALWEEPRLLDRELAVASLCVATSEVMLALHTSQKEILLFLGLSVGGLGILLFALFRKVADEPDPPSSGEKSKGHINESLRAVLLVIIMIVCFVAIMALFDSF